jgi:hypothetical protein
MVGSRNILPFSSERKLLGGNDILQIKKEESVRHTIEKIVGMRNIDVSGQLIHNQATSSAFLDMRINIKVVNMIGVKLGRGHLNKRFQHLYKNLHI